MPTEAVSPERFRDCVSITTTALGISEAQILDVSRQTGGLFNYVLRVSTENGEFFFKQYLDDAPNPIFDVPKIPAALRAELAYEVQKLAVEAIADYSEDIVPAVVMFDRARASFLMEKAAGERSLNECLSVGDIPSAFFVQTPVVLARLHQVSYDRFSRDSLYGNIDFRDFKLKLQYDDVAARLAPQEAQATLQCKAAHVSDSSCVLHGDINSRNILVSERGIGVIDFEQSHLGSPAYDLAYILCEVFISLETFGGPGASRPRICEFLDRYFREFDAASRDRIEGAATRHFAVQTLYRFWGPSRNAWTFYVDDANRDRIIGSARTILLKNAPLSAALLS